MKNDTILNTGDFRNDVISEHWTQNKNPINEEH
jgi:hypothetical protein